MNTVDKLALYNKLFVHRTDTYLEQWIDHRGIHYSRKEQNFTDDLLLEHLQGKNTYSLYPMSEEDTVKWLCFDVDVNPRAKKELTEDAAIEHTKAVVRNVARALFQMSIPFRVERSGSKGFHLWVFFDKPLPTYKAHMLGQFVQIHVPPHDFVNIEVFPKHRAYSAESFSFSVKLPLGIHKKTNVRCFFVDSAFTDYKDQWQLLSSIKFLTEAQLDDIIKEWGIKEEPEVAPSEYPPSDYVCMSRIMSEGVENGNRDDGFFQLACFLQAQGMPYSIADKVLNEVNDNGTPPFTSQQLKVKLDSAYNKNYYPSPCQDSNLDSFCSSSCRRWERKVKRRWSGRRKQEAVGIISRD